MAGVSLDVTAARRAELMREALLRLNDDLRDIDDPGDISFAAGRILAETLGVDRAGYGIVDPVTETIAIERELGFTHSHNDDDSVIDSVLESVLDSVLDLTDGDAL